MAFNVTFWGAAGTVTGSCYLVQADGVKFIVDCGMFQGPDVEECNFAKWDFNPADVDFVLLTHGHLDHVGLLPKLIKHGFRGDVYATLHTIQIASLIMQDSAKIQEDNYTKGIPWQFSNRLEVVYNSHDVDITLSLLRPVDFDEPLNLPGGVVANFRRAGHILGAASIELDIDGKVIVFSGDIGRAKHPLIVPFDQNYSREVDYVIMESLYGGQTHPQRTESVQEMMDIVKDTFQRGGSVFIPSFAVQRTQELLNDFKHAKEGGVLPGDLQIWLDSPMAQRVTKIYSDALDHSKESSFDFEGLNYVNNSRQSSKISKKGRQVIIAGSGMANGGRIVGHLQGNLKRADNAVVFVGYQAEATLGRDLVDGKKRVDIDGALIDVKAQIHQLGGFSGHGDDQDLHLWLKRYHSPKLAKVILVHAEPERANIFATELTDEGYPQPVRPAWKQTITL